MGVIEDNEKYYSINFKTKKTFEQVVRKNWLHFRLACKKAGLNGKSLIIDSNLTAEEKESLMDFLHPPKTFTDKNQQKVWERILKDINVDPSLFAKAPTLTKPLNGKEIVEKLNEMSEPFIFYKVLRPSLFFCKDQTVTLERLKTKFTEEAIKLMVEDGYLELSVKYNTMGVYPDVLNGDTPNSFMRDELNGIDLSSFRHMGFFAPQQIVTEPIVTETKKEIPNSKGTSHIFYRKNNEDTVCDAIERQIKYFDLKDGDFLDIHLSKRLFKELCEVFGGRVKKYKGHKIIVA